MGTRWISTIGRRKWARVAQKEEEERTIDVIGNDSIGFEPGVELVSHSVYDDGVETDSVKEVETQSERFELVRENRTSDFQYGEMSCGREDLKVSRDFTTGSERVE